MSCLAICKLRRRHPSARQRDASAIGIFAKTDLSPALTDANKLVSSMEDLIRRTIGPPIQLDVAATESLWMIQLDQNQLENALLNLCINARDAMPPGVASPSRRRTS